MRILVVHNFHRKGSSSGDDQVFKSETRLLEKEGFQIVKYTVSNDSFDQKNVFGKIWMTIGMIWSFKRYKEIQFIIEQNKPDIMHVHTFFPLLSPSVLYAAKRKRIPVVATLHDTRFICPSAYSLRNQQLCIECGDGHYSRMCRNKCYKNSTIQSLILAVIFKYHRIRKSFYKQIDRYICLNDNQIKMLVDIGFDPKKIVKKYNFVEASNETIKETGKLNLPEKYVAYFGRIGEEKGIWHLMNIWDSLPDIPIVIMGGGPLDAEISKWGNSHRNVYYLGYTEHDLCLSIVKGCEFVVFPSICYEGCSMIVIEAQSLGKSIVAFDVGFSSEAIVDGYNGYKAQLGDDEAFRNIVKRLFMSPNNCIEMGKNAKEEYEKKYTEEINARQIKEIYNNVLAEEQDV